MFTPLQTTPMPKADPVAPPPPVSSTPPTPNLPLPSGTQQVGLKNSMPSKIRVRAWVNGKPIFDDEIMAAIPQAFFRQLAKLPDVPRQEKQAEMFAQVLDNIIDQEAAYQEAIKKIEKMNPRAMEKLKEAAVEEFHKQVNTNLPKDQENDPIVKEALTILKRQVERNFIHMEYLRSQIIPAVNLRISFAEVEDYYRTHLNEFQKVDSVKWQNVFIAVNSDRPTVAHCKKYAEQLLAGLPNATAFAELTKYDDGDSKFRGGSGMGVRKGEIKPAEVEPILFKLKDGEIGPIVEISTGVHLMRLEKREFGGQMPLNEEVQKQIRNRLRGIIADREYKRKIREIRDRSVVEIDKES
ncbi:MAG: peptidyl-prolyl cis-trans isomerase [Gemmataceae bacterium]